MKLTGVKLRMMQILRDGKPHRKEELRNCLFDTDVSTDNINPHLSDLRKILQERHHDILIQYIQGRLFYRLVRLIS